VLNEERRLRTGICRTVAYLDETAVFDYELLIVDNGSTDATPTVGEDLAREFARVSYLRLGEKGVGLAFRQGSSWAFDEGESDVIGYMDVDLSTDITHLEAVKELLEPCTKVDIVNGSRNHRDSVVVGKKLSRKITSQGLRIILQVLFNTRLTDTICGFKFFKREVLKQLIATSSTENGWFYCIELLLRAERQGFVIHEIPVVWHDDSENTKVHVWKLIREYLRNIRNLYTEIGRGTHSR
jgi:glycosyltransferase involved in cell wall biosynthesis